MPQEFDKMVVAGFDGLDYGKIKKYGCENLEQETFGKLDLEGIELKTPVLWASMITGEKPEVHGVDRMLKFRGKKAKKLDSKIKAFFDLFGRNAVKLKETLMYYLFESSLAPPDRKFLEVDTIFDRVADSVALDVPGYSQYPYLQGKMGVGEVNWKNSALTRDRVKRDLDAEHMYRKKQLFDEINDHRLVMQHFHYCDWYQHLYPSNEEKGRTLYREMDELAGEILEKADEDTLVVFVSDHGVRDGGHVDQAFYSVNTELEGEVKITELLFRCLEKLDYSEKERMEEIDF